MNLISPSPGLCLKLRAHFPHTRGFCAPLPPLVPCQVYPPSPLTCCASENWYQAPFMGPKKKEGKVEKRGGTNPHDPPQHTLCQVPTHSTPSTHIICLLYNVSMYVSALSYAHIGQLVSWGPLQSVPWPSPIGLPPCWEVRTACISASRSAGSPPYTEGVSLRYLFYIGTTWVSLSELLRQGASLHKLLKK